VPLREAPGDHRRADEPAEMTGLPRSDTDPGAPLTAACGQDRAASPGPHAQPEAVRLRAVAVVRLERTLAHGDSRSKEKSLVVTGPPAHMRELALTSGRTHERYARQVPLVKPARGDNSSISPLAPPVAAG
jgi:hypothetical protein